MKKHQRSGLLFVMYGFWLIHMNRGDIAFCVGGTMLMLGAMMFLDETPWALIKDTVQLIRLLGRRPT